MVHEFHDILCFIAAAQLLLFSLFLVTQKKGDHLSNRLLALLLFAKCLGIVNHLFFRMGLKSPHMYFVFVPFAFLWGPLLYLYIKSRVSENYQLQKKDMMHLIPFLMSWIYFILIYHTKSAPIKNQILARVKHGITIPQIVFFIILHLIIFFYIVWSVRMLQVYKSKLNSLLRMTGRENLSWLRFIVYGFILIWSIDVFEFILRLLVEPPLFLSSMALVLLFIFANVIVFQGLRIPEVFQGNRKTNKYQNSPLTKEEKEGYLARLREYMEREEPYLNPSLSLDRLARRLAIPSRYLSQIINESLGVNFFDFVKRYRVEEVKKLFMDSSNGNRNIIDLLFDAGFNTKSVFNRAFKKYTGMTPSEFKSTHLPDLKDPPSR